MYRNNGQVKFLESVHHKKGKFKRYKTKEKGFFSIDENEALFPWESSLQKRIDKKSKHLFQNTNAIHKVENNDILGDMFTDVPSNSNKSKENNFLSQSSSINSNEMNTSGERKFKPFEIKMLRLGDEGEIYHFSNILKEEKLNPQLYSVPNQSLQKTMDPEGWRKNCNFIPIDPKKNRLQKLGFNLESSNNEKIINDNNLSYEEELKQYNFNKKNKLLKQSKTNASSLNASRLNASSLNKFSINPNKLRRHIRENIES